MRSGPPRRRSRATVKRTEVRLWDIETGERIRDLSRSGRDRLRLRRPLARRPEDGRRQLQGLRMLDAATVQPQWTIDLPGWWGRPVAFSSDGTLVALPDQNAVAIFEVSTGRRLHHDESTPVGRVGAAAWSPSGDRIVTGHSDGFVRVWDAATGKLIWHKLLAPVVSLGGWSADPAFVGFSRNGKLRGRGRPPGRSGRTPATGSSRSTRPPAARWCARSLGDEFRLGGAGTRRPDGRRRLTTTAIAFVGIEAATGRTRWANPHREQAGRLRAAGRVAIRGEPDLVRGGPERRQRDPLQCAHRPRAAPVPRRWTDARAAESRPPGEPVMSAAAFSADGRTMASSSDGWVCVWDVEAGTLRRRIRYPHARLLARPGPRRQDGRDLGRPKRRGLRRGHDPPVRRRDRRAGAHARTRRRPGQRAGVLARRHQAPHRIPAGLRHRLGRAPRARGIESKIMRAGFGQVGQPFTQPHVV